MTPANVLAYLAQVTLVVIVCAGLPRVLGLRSPAIHYAFWRTVLAVCLLLPIVQPWQPVEMTFVPAPGPAAAAADTPVRTAPAPRPAAAAIDWFTALPATLIANPWGVAVLVGGAVLTGALAGLAVIRSEHGPKES